MKKLKWLVANGVIIVLCMLMAMTVVTKYSDRFKSLDQLSGEDAMAYSWKASQYFCAGIYYTDKVLTTNPELTTYKKWQKTVDQAEESWEALDDVLTILEEQVDEDTFETMFKKHETHSGVFSSFTSYAFDSEEIINRFDSAEAGQRLKAVAEFLRKDMKYAQQALKMANGEITAESWNNYADTVHKFEAAARLTKTVAQSAALYLGSPATSVLEGTAFVVSGASLIWQGTDDFCFIYMGSDYDQSEFVANLQSVTDFVAPIAFTSGLLTMDFTKDKEAVLSIFGAANELRNIIQDGKIAGIQLKGERGNVISLTPEELLDYQIAKENGQKLSDEIVALLEMLEPEPEPEPTTEPTTEPITEELPESSAETTSQASGNNNDEIDSDMYLLEFSDYIGEWYAVSMVQQLGGAQGPFGLNEETSGAYLNIYNDGTAEYIVREVKGTEIVDGDVYYHEITYDNGYILNDYAGSRDLDFELIVADDGYLYICIESDDFEDDMYLVFTKKGEEEIPSVVGTYSTGEMPNEFLGGTTESVYVYNADGTFQYMNIHSAKEYVPDVLYEGRYKVVKADEYAGYLYQVMEYENGGNLASGSMSIFETDMNNGTVISLSGTYFKK